MSRCLGDLLGHAECGMHGTPVLVRDNVLGFRSQDKESNSHGNKFCIRNSHSECSKLCHQSNHDYATISMVFSILFSFSCLRSCEPEINKIKFEPEKQYILLLCSDGVWESWILHVFPV